MSPFDGGRRRSLLQFERALDKCPGCGRRSTMVATESGEMACSKCGFVAREGLVDPHFNRLHFREQDNGHDSRRSWEPVSRVMGDVGRATKIGNGEPVNEEMKRLIARDSWIKISKEDRGLNDAKHVVKGVADGLALPDSLVERAIQIYRKAVSVGLHGGQSGRGLAFAALYAACREGSIPRSASSVAEASGTDLKRLLSAYRALVERLDLKMPAPDPIAYIGGIVSRTGLSERTGRRAAAVYKEFSKSGEGLGKSPLSRAAGAVCVACHLESEPRNQAELAEAAGVSEYTVRAAAREILSVLNLRLNMRRLSSKSK